MKVDKWIEGSKSYNEKASQRIDENFDGLLRESERTNLLAM